MGCKSLKFPTERLFAGGHRGVVTPVPIPNTEVKGSIAEGSAGLARARVGRRRLFLPPFGEALLFSGLLPNAKTPSLTRSS